MLKNKESKMACVQVVQNRKREEASEMLLGVELFSNQLMACKHKHTLVLFSVDWQSFKHFQKWLPCYVWISRFQTPPVRQATRTTTDFVIKTKPWNDLFLRANSSVKCRQLIRKKIEWNQCVNGIAWYSYMQSFCAVLTIRK